MVAVATLLGACSLPPLNRSVVVETTRQGVPVHAQGKVDGHSYTVVRGDTLYSIAFRSGVDYRELARWNGIGEPYVIHPGQRLRLSGSRQLPPRAPVAAATPNPAANAAQAPVFETVPSTPTATVPTATAAASASVVSPTPATPASTIVAVAGQAPVAAPVNAPPPVAVVVTPPEKTRRAGGITWSWPADGALLKGFQANDAIPGIDIAGSRGDPVRAAADGVVVYSGNGLVGYGELIIIKHNDSYLSAYGHNRERLVKEGEKVRAGQTIAKMGSSGASRDELQFQIRRDGTPVNPLDYLPGR
jgi:lipoprotein NlpD